MFVLPFLHLSFFLFFFPPFLFNLVKRRDRCLFPVTTCSLLGWPKWKSVEKRKPYKKKKKKKVPNECQLSSTFSLNNLHPVTWAISVPSFSALGTYRAQTLACTQRARPRQPIAPYKSKEPPLGLDRNNKQQMIHDGDGECIQ